MNVLKRDKRVPRNLSEDRLDFWEWIQAIVDGIDDAIDAE